MADVSWKADVSVCVSVSIPAVGHTGPCPMVCVTKVISMVGSARAICGGSMSFFVTLANLRVVLRCAQACETEQTERAGRAVRLCLPLAVVTHLVLVSVRDGLRLLVIHSGIATTLDGAWASGVGRTIATGRLASLAVVANVSTFAHNSQERASLTGTV